MVFKNFITSGWNRLKNDIHQGLIGAKNVAHRVWNATKKGLIGAKNFAVNNPKAVGFALQALTPFATAFNPTLGVATSIGANLFNNMPKGPIKEKILKISEQLARGELKQNNMTDSNNSVGGSSFVQAAVDSRRSNSRKSSKWIPFRGV